MNRFNVKASKLFHLWAAQFVECLFLEWTFSDGEFLEESATLGGCYR